MEVPGNRGAKRRGSTVAPQAMSGVSILGVYSQNANETNGSPEQSEGHSCGEKKGREILFSRPFETQMVEVPGFVRQCRANLF